jgi:hypothetical protein
MEDISENASIDIRHPGLEYMVSFPLDGRIMTSFDSETQNGILKRVVAGTMFEKNL